MSWLSDLFGQTQLPPFQGYNAQRDTANLSQMANEFLKSQQPGIQSQYYASNLYSGGQPGIQAQGAANIGRAAESQASEVAKQFALEASNLQEKQRQEQNAYNQWKSQVEQQNKRNMWGGIEKLATGGVEGLLGFLNPPKQTTGQPTTPQISSGTFLGGYGPEAPPELAGQQGVASGPMSFFPAGMNYSQAGGNRWQSGLGGLFTGLGGQVQPQQPQPDMNQVMQILQQLLGGMGGQEGGGMDLAALLKMLGMGGI